MEGAPRMQLELWFGAGWYLWAFACALGVRIILVRVLKPRFGRLAHVGAYLGWIALLIAGVLLAALTGLKSYGFDPTNPAQKVGYLILVFSPIGLPLLAGAPFVLIFDLVVSLSRRLRMVAGPAPTEGQ